MKKHTKCRMNEICKIPHRDGECERNCYYSTIEVKANADKLRSMSDDELAEYLANICYDFWAMLDDDPKKVWLDWLRKEAQE